MRVHVRKGLVGEAGIELIDFAWSPTLTPRALLDRITEHLPYSDCTVDVGIDGRRISDIDLDVPLNEDAHVIVVPTTTGGVSVLGIIIYALIAAAVSAGINYAMQALAPRQKPPGVPQERGDQTSPTYAWDGIQTSFGQGFPVPVAYGRVTVGGQVIYTDVFASTASGLVDDRLNLILALSEGPIARVGDVVAGELNGLGGVAGGTPGPSLPDEIRVNDVLLETTSTSATVRHTLTGAWTNGPTFDPGNFLDVMNGAIQVGQVQVLAINNGTPRTDLDLLLIAGGSISVGNTLRDNRFVPPPVATVTSVLVVQRTNSTPGAVAYIRPGSLDQTALPSNPFRGTSVTFSPNNQLDEANQEAIFTYSNNDEVTTVGIVMVCPAGCYEQDNQGNLSAYPITFDISWRYEGETTWRGFWNAGNPTVSLNSFQLGTVARTGPVIETYGANPASSLQPPVFGPIEVRVLRRSPSGGTGTVSNAVWRNVFFNSANVLKYPRVALLGLTLSSGARFSGGLPNITVRIDGIKVRVWHDSYGFSARTWDAFTSGNWALSIWPPGRNPAWILLDFLTAPWGLGKYLTDADIDLPAFRRWAAWCDRDASPSEPWNTPQFQCDLVMDTPRPAWEWVLAICGAGRASPIYRGGKISVVYDYRDAHTDLGGLSVPAVAPVQLITSGNCEKVMVEWLPIANRPTAFQFQFANEALQHRQDVFVAEDTGGNMNDPSAINREQWRPETIQAYGVTREAQVFREGVYRHRINRLIRRQLTFTTGRWALAAEVGDLFEFETELLRPFPDTPLTMIVTVGGSAVTSIEVDHVVVLPGEIVVRDADGKPQRSSFTPGTVSSVNKTLALSNTVTCAAGATCVVGTEDQLTEVYKIVSITLQRDLKREVKALQWVPEIHDEVTPTMYAAGGEDFVDRGEAVPVEPTVDFRDLRVVPVRSGNHRIQFARMPSRKAQPARVYVRASGDTSWTSLGSTESDSIEHGHFVPGLTYEVALCFESFNGDATLPDAGQRFTFKAEEFPPLPPPALTSVRATNVDSGVLVEWDGIDVLDLAYYEVRQGGSCWNGGRVVYRGREPRFIWQPPAGATPTLLCAVRATSNLYGPSTAVVVPAWVPAGTVAVIDEDDLAPSPAGTHSSTQWTSPVLELTAAAYDGTYTSAAQDAGYQAPFWWSVRCEFQVLDDALVDDLDFELDSGEAHWRTLNGRQASAGRPGVDFNVTVDDLTTAIEELPSTLMVHGNRGEAGAHARVLVESRFEVSGVWSDYKPHVDRMLAARKMQVRLSLNRETLTHQVQVTALRFAAHI
jgi:hypothetical protein